MNKTQRVTFVLTEEQATQLKIMAILTKKTMSTFIRNAIFEKIKQLKAIEKP